MKTKKTRETADRPACFVVHNFLEQNQPPFRVFPDRFVAELSSEDSSVTDLAFNNFVRLTVGPPGTDRKVVEEIAAGAIHPFAVHSVSPVLEEKPMIRGQVCFGHVWKEIDKLSLNWEDMHWWITEKGLCMEILNPAELAAKIKVSRLSPFDQLAGRLFAENMINDRVSNTALAQIARELDREGFSLKEELKPGDWTKIADHNQKHSFDPIRTWERAIEFHARGVRIRLSEAKTHYEKAQDARLSPPKLVRNSAAKNY